MQHRLRTFAAALLPLLLLPAAAAVRYEPATWNAYGKYEAFSVPERLLFFAGGDGNGGSGSGDGGSGSGSGGGGGASPSAGPLFPVTRSGDVEVCAAPVLLCIVQAPRSWHAALCRAGEERGERSRARKTESLLWRARPGGQLSNTRPLPAHRATNPLPTLNRRLNTPHCHSPSSG